MPRLQRFQSRRHPTSEKPSLGVGRIWHQGQHHLTRLHCHGHGGTTFPTISGAKDGVARTEHVGEVEQAGRV